MQDGWVLADDESLFEMPGSEGEEDGDDEEWEDDLDWDDEDEDDLEEEWEEDDDEEWEEWENEFHDEDVPEKTTPKPDRWN